MTINEEFNGFDKSKRILHCHEARARIFGRLRATDLFSDGRLTAAHIENTSRIDRVQITAFNEDGEFAASETLYVDEFSDALGVVAEFDHDFTGMSVTTGSALEDLLATETGWVLDLRALRSYDLVEDRRITQRAIVLANLQDMLVSGEANGFVLPAMRTADDPEPGIAAA